MDMVWLNGEFNHLDIAFEPFGVFQDCFRVCLHPRICEQSVAISRSPHDMVFRFVRCVSTFTKVHNDTIVSCRVDCGSSPAQDARLYARIIQGQKYQGLALKKFPLRPDLGISDLVFFCTQKSMQSKPPPKVISRKCYRVLWLLPPCSNCPLYPQTPFTIRHFALDCSSNGTPKSHIRHPFLSGRTHERQRARRRSQAHGRGCARCTDGSRWCF